MSDLGQSRHFDDVSAMSAYPSIATEERPSQKVGFLPIASKSKDFGEQRWFGSQFSVEAFFLLWPDNEDRSHIRRAVDITVSPSEITI